MKWRVSLLSLIVGLLSFLTLGAVKEFGNDIPYPANAAFSVVGGAEIESSQVFEAIAQLADEQALTIFYPFMTDEGQTQTFVFGQPVAPKKGYVSDRQALATQSASGMYYVDKSLPKALVSRLEGLGVVVRGADLPWYLTPFYFFINNLRALAIWTIFVSSALLLFAVKLFFIKKTMVQRSLGLLGRSQRRDVLVELLTVLGTGLTLMLVFWLSQGFELTAFVKSFAFLSAINLVVLLVIVLLVNALFALNARLQAVTGVLKNKTSGQAVLHFWFLAILVSCFIFNLTLSQTWQVVSETQDRINQLSRWEVARDFYRLTFLDEMSQHTSETGEIDGDFLRADAAKFRTFLASFSEENYLYQSPSGLRHMPPAIQEELGVTIDQALINQLLYVNQGLLLKNKAIYPDNDYGAPDLTGAGVIYVPSRYLSRLDEITSYINHEYFKYSALKAEQFVVQEIPDGQKTFLFNISAGQGELFANQELTDGILVDINWSQVPEGDSVEYSYSEVAMKALFHKEGLQQRLHQAGITNVGEMTNAASTILLERDRIASQLQGTVLSILLLLGGQFFIVYQYIATILQKRAKKLVIVESLGHTSLPLLMRWFTPLMLGLGLVFALTLVWTKMWLVGLFILLLYGLEVVTMLLYAIRRLRQRRVQLLKGDFEIL